MFAAAKINHQTEQARLAAASKPVPWQFCRSTPALQQIHSFTGGESLGEEGTLHLLRKVALPLLPDPIPYGRRGLALWRRVAQGAASRRRRSRRCAAAAAIGLATAAGAAPAAAAGSVVAALRIPGCLQQSGICEGVGSAMRVRC